MTYLDEKLALIGLLALTLIAFVGLYVTWHLEETTDRFVAEFGKRLERRR